MTERLTDWQDIHLGELTLEALVRGSGEPVVLIQTALTADELVPLAQQPPLAEDYRVVLYHRRGYGRSTAVQGPGSIARDADDCARLLEALGIERAHVVGLSYSAAVALELAATEPEMVASLCLIEPPPVHIPSADEFVAANKALQTDYRERGAEVALDRFLTKVIGPDWLRDLEEHLPGGAQQARQGANAFFATDIPALLAWTFGDDDPSEITSPVLYVGGTASGPWFEQVHRLIMDWFPQAEDVMIEGADHSLAFTHPAQVAQALVAFLRQHPLAPGMATEDAAPPPSTETGKDRRLQMGRLSTEIPAAGEAFRQVMSLPGVRVEHIVSSDTPDTGLQRQAWDEWVLVMAGRAQLEIDGSLMDLAAGEWLLLPAATPHRVVATARGTHWLAVHVDGSGSA